MKLGKVAVFGFGFLAIVSSASAQNTTSAPRLGHPQDWSQRHVVFTRDGIAKHPEVMSQERVLQQIAKRYALPNFGAFESSDSLKQTGEHRDWAVTVGGHVANNQFPAKFSFYPDAPPSCTNDFVVFGLSNDSTASGKPNLVAFNNLYSDPINGGGLCDPPTGPGTGPTVLFAYNITTLSGGHIITSPILSLDGTKIGFIEGVPAQMGIRPTAEVIFHVLTWTAGQGTLTMGATPIMSSLLLTSTTGDVRSSPWIDYTHDTSYIGQNDGVVHQITGVFNGTPTLDPAGSGWPVAAGVLQLTSPVLDEVRGLLMVGSANGNLYQIDTTVAPPVVNSVLIGTAMNGGMSPGIIGAPVVDVTNGTTFVTTANDGNFAALIEVNTANLNILATASLGLGARGGTGMSLYEPAFSNNYFNDPSSGYIRVCGTSPTDTSPYQYAFGFNGNTMQESPTISQQLITTSVNARCTGWTEFYNPNIGGGTDFFFFGLNQDCSGTGTGSTDGCVAEVKGQLGTSPTRVTINGGPTGIVIDNYSTAPQASSIYFTALKAPTAYKLTQNGLN